MVFCSQTRTRHSELPAQHGPTPGFALIPLIQSNSAWLHNHSGRCLQRLSCFSLLLSQSVRLNLKKVHAWQLLPWIVAQKCTPRRLLTVARQRPVLFNPKHRRPRPFTPLGGGVPIEARGSPRPPARHRSRRSPGR